MELQKLEEIARKIARAANAASGIYIAMEEGSCKPEEWLDGLYYVLTGLGEEAAALLAFVDAQYEEKRRATGKNE